MREHIKRDAVFWYSAVVYFVAAMIVGMILSAWLSPDTLPALRDHGFELRTYGGRIECIVDIETGERLSCQPIGGSS